MARIWVAAQCGLRQSAGLESSHPQSSNLSTSWLAGCAPHCLPARSEQSAALHRTRTEQSVAVQKKAYGLHVGWSRMLRKLWKLRFKLHEKVLKEVRSRRHRFLEKINEFNES